MTIISGDTYAERAIAGTLGARGDSSGKLASTTVGPQGPAGAAGTGAVSTTTNVATAPAFDTWRKNTTGKLAWIAIRCGVVSAPQQNGHIYFDVAPDLAGVADSANSAILDYVACRNNQNAGTGAGTVQSGGPNIGNGRAVQGFVPNNFWYRLRTFTAAGYGTPTFITDTPNPMSYVLIG